LCFRRDWRTRRLFAILMEEGREHGRREGTVTN
jgi:hypothetical protein